LSPDPGSKSKIRILINGEELVAFNPFNPHHPATQELEEQQITVYGEKIRIQAYVLPHYSKLPVDEYTRYAGPAGYLQNQGFYVYRNKRLIIKGTWFRLAKKEELNKLIRVRVDIPNTLDHLWRIDVKKSQAVLPELIKKELRKIIGKIEVSGKRVYSQRGTRLSTRVQFPVWKRIASKGSIVYSINREYPLIQEYIKTSSGNQRVFIHQILSTVESSFPGDMYFHDIAENPERVEKVPIEEKGLNALVDVFIKAWNDSGMGNEEVAKKILASDPFCEYEKQTAIILKKKGYLG
jgi:hypothetical protein